MDNCLQNIGKRIAERRRSAGLTQEEIWNHLWDELQPLEIVIGYDVVPVFTDSSFADKVVGLRVELTKESILMPIVRIRDHSRLHSKEVMILAYQNVLYNEELDAVDEKTLDYIIQRLGETVRSKYAEILNVDMIKDLIDSVKITYPALVESIVPDKLSYGLILDVTRGFLERGNGMVYFPRILEFLEHEVRESANADKVERAIEEAASKCAEGSEYIVVPEVWIFSNRT